MEGNTQAGAGFETVERQAEPSHKLIISQESRKDPGPLSSNRLTRTTATKKIHIPLTSAMSFDPVTGNFQPSSGHRMELEMFYGLSDLHNSSLTPWSYIAQDPAHRVDPSSTYYADKLAMYGEWREDHKTESYQAELYTLQEGWHQADSSAYQQVAIPSPASLVITQDQYLSLLNELGCIGEGRTPGQPHYDVRAKLRHLRRSVACWFPDLSRGKLLFTRAEFEQQAEADRFSFPKYGLRL